MLCVVAVDKWCRTGSFAIWRDVGMLPVVAVDHCCRDSSSRYDNRGWCSSELSHVVHVEVIHDMAIRKWQNAELMHVVAIDQRCRCGSSRCYLSWMKRCEDIACCSHRCAILVRLFTIYNRGWCDAGTEHGVAIDERSRFEALHDLTIVDDVMQERCML